eukprot:c25215_g1_i1.p1 GENE.c25215_g1_i1~~c25215_g1_i1.p1  ORF type:complete len:389 (+),score=63.28 c25215_g1_i1:74-1240(+)
MSSRSFTVNLPRNTTDPKEELSAADMDIVATIAGMQRENSMDAIQHPCPDRGLIYMILVAMLPFVGFVGVVKHQFTTNVGVLENVKNDNFPSVVTLFFTVTCTIVGIGLEALVGLQIIRNVAINHRLVIVWKFVQLLFPLLITIAVFCKSPFGLLMLALGLWKLGFPEVVGSMLSAVLLIDLPLTQRIAFFLNAVFLLFHHVCAAYVVCGIISNEFALTRQIVSVVIPLIVQHWLSLAKYSWAKLFTVLQLITEIWFETEVFCNAPRIPGAPRAALFFMVVSHWGLLLSGAFAMYSDKYQKSAPATLSPKEVEPDLEDGDTETMQPVMWKRSVSRYEDKKRHSMNTLKRNKKTTLVPQESVPPSIAPSAPEPRIRWGEVGLVSQDGDL